ncbi:hypothetical protein [Streptomyces tropicalis]|uniref:Uncharacterized protein n=1 Tax=Streptomyces tropicalis TaxID=3034234 RepID=A0ABT6AA23_9ACTN|nr:hypothetical protein [Streptomyces tropicalis]MDF3301499.1 hypothetical protein [Streptomyces tropicalis]
MTATSRRCDAALEPVRAALLAEARADAAAEAARARADARETLAAARARADVVLAEARETGRRDGAAAAALDLVHARRDAAHAELAARQAAFDTLRRRVADGVRTEAAHRDGLPEALAARAHRLLGPDATITPGPGGGVVAAAPGRRVDLTPAALAERALTRLGARTEDLWAP